MWIGWIEFDVLLGDVHSLKEKRAVLRPLLADLRRSTEASVAEVDDQDLHRRDRLVGKGVEASIAEPNGQAHARGIGVKPVLCHLKRHELNGPQLTGKVHLLLRPEIARLVGWRKGRREVRR